MKVLHHNDLDGNAAAAIFYFFYPEATYIECDYRHFPIEKIEKNEEVIIVDYSCESKELWEKLFSITKDILWIDHHETSLKNFDKWFPGKVLKGIQSVSRCGTWLSWEWCFLDREVPIVVEMIDRWDRWTHNDDPDILNFQAGSEAINIAPNSHIWDPLLLKNNQRIKQQMIEDGKVIRRYKTKINKENIEKYAYSFQWEGYNCLVLNGPDHGSKTFDSVKREYDVYMSYIFDGSQYEVHIYSDIVKVNEIALKHGGGGHPGAAGFEVKQLPWEKEK